MLKKFFLVCLISAGFAVSYAQNPYNWTFTAKKIADRTYEIHCTAEVREPWHTYSQTTPAGGPVPTKFSFLKNPLYTLDGIVKEEGTLITKHEAVFGVDVKYFKGKVDFVQKLKLKGNAKTNVSGSVEFMICNDEQCLQPATEKFSIALQ